MITDDNLSDLLSCLIITYLFKYALISTKLYDMINWSLIINQE